MDSIDQLKQENVKLQERLANAAKFFKDQKLQIEKLTNENIRLNEYLNEYELKLESAETQLKEQADNYENQITLLQENNIKLGEEVNTLDEYNKKLSNMEAAYDELRKKYAELKDLHDDDLKRYNELEDNYEALQNHCTQVEAESILKDAKITAFDNEIEEEKRQTSTTQVKLDDALEEISSLRANLINANVEYEKLKEKFYDNMQQEKTNYDISDQLEKLTNKCKRYQEFAKTILNAAQQLNNEISEQEAVQSSTPNTTNNKDNSSIEITVNKKNNEFRPQNLPVMTI